MKTKAQEAKGFVQEVVNELKKSQTEPVAKVESLLFKISEHATHEHEATVESAVALSPSELEKITAVLTHVAGVSLKVVNEVDPTLIGGLRIRMADLVIDTSIRYQLQAMIGIINS